MIRPDQDSAGGWFIILESPKDIDLLWQKLERPDLMVIKGERIGAAGVRTLAGIDRGEPSAYLIESVRVEGRVDGDRAHLTVVLGVTLKAEGPIWVPVRLDSQWLVDAKEGARKLSLRSGPARQWQVNLAGSGEHRIEIELRVAVRSNSRGRRFRWRFRKPPRPWWSLSFHSDHQTS